MVHFAPEWWFTLSGIYSFNNVVDYAFIDNGNGMLLKTAAQQGGTAISSLKWVNLKDNAITDIWTFSSPDTILNTYTVDNGGTQILIAIQQGKGTEKGNTIWYFKKGMIRAAPKVTSSTPGIKQGHTIQASTLQFSEDGKFALFNLAPPPASKPQPNSVKVDIWNYRDSIL